jgi:hypothetical protein
MDILQSSTIKLRNFISSLTLEFKMASTDLIATNLVNSGFPTVRDFQTAYGLPATGALDTITASTLNQRRCQMSDVADPLHVRDLNANGQTPRRLENLKPYAATRVLGRKITFSFSSYTRDMATRAQRKCVIRAFKTWQRVLPVWFKWERRGRASRNADMRIAFHHGGHGDGAPFDGMGGTLAHAFFPCRHHPICSDIHFDDGETWRDDARAGPADRHIDLETVALHEIGHALGLPHSTTPGAAMEAFYGGARRRLHTDDIKAGQALYGARRRKRRRKRRRRRRRRRR